MYVKIDEAILGAQDIFVSAGMSEDDARVLSESLVYAESRGVMTHGLKRVESYYHLLENALVATNPDERVLSEKPGSALIDGAGGFGAPAGVRAINRAMDMAKTTGVAYVAVKDVAHFGAAGFYTDYAANRGFLALVGSSSSPSVLPFGGIEPKIGNSPMSFAAPGRQESAFMIDMAQSATSRGRIRLAVDGGESIPEGWAVDSNGNSTTDPAAALAGGLLPSGGHKGSGLSLMVEMLAAGLPGANLTKDTVNMGMTASTLAVELDPSQLLVGTFYLVIDSAAFGGAAEVLKRSDEIADNVRSARPRPGFASVMAPGDPEKNSVTAAVAEGLKIDDGTARALRALIHKAGLTSNPFDWS